MPDLNSAVTTWVVLSLLLLAVSVRGLWLAIRALMAFQAWSVTFEREELSLVAKGNAARMVVWIGIGLAYLWLGVPLLESQTVVWTLGVKILSGSLVAMVFVAFMDQAIKARLVTLAAQALARREAVEASRIELAIAENIRLTRQTLEETKETKDAANHSLEKFLDVKNEIADLNKRLLEETHGRKDAIEGDRRQVDHIQETTDATHDIVSRSDGAPDKPDQNAKIAALHKLQIEERRQRKEADAAHVDDPQTTEAHDEDHDKAGTP